MSQLRNGLLFAGMVVLLGVNFVAVRFSNQELAPFWGAASRFVIAAAFLAVVLQARGIPWPRGKALVGAATFGALAFGATFGLLYWALQEAPASLASVLFATVPLLTLVMAASLRFDSLHARAVAGSLLALVGAVLVSWTQVQTVPAARLAAIALAAILAAASGVVVRAFPRSHPLATNAAGMGTGAILLLALTFGTSTPTAVPALASTWLAFAWLVGSSIVAFAIMVHLIAQWGPTRTSYSAVLAPLVTAIVATWLADESITAGLASGGVLVLGGVYMGLSGNVKP